MITYEPATAPHKAATGGRASQSMTVFRDQWSRLYNSMRDQRSRLYNVMPQKKRKNPFYILLMIVGTAFAITVCGYGVMMVRMGQPHALTPGDRFFDTYGMWLMAGELTLLTIFTFAAIGTDDYWTRNDNL